MSQRKDIFRMFTKYVLSFLSHKHFRYFTAFQVHKKSYLNFSVEIAL